MSSSTILGTVEGFVRRRVSDETDWETIIKICDECQGAADRTHSVINSLLANLKDPKSTPEILYNSLVLLDVMVKNVSYARVVVATKDVCKLMEKVAKLQEKEDIAKKLSKSNSRMKQSSSTSLIYSISSSSSDYDKWSPDDKAMRMIQSWGMLHPAEFPIYLKSVEKWKKAGVVFPAADPEDLVPLPKSVSEKKSSNKVSYSSNSSASSSSSSTKKSSAKVSYSMTSSSSSESSTKKSTMTSNQSNTTKKEKIKNKFMIASERIINAANNSSSLLLDMCTNVGEDGFCVDSDVIESCIAQCKEFSPKLEAFIEALLSESEIVKEIPESKREGILNSLLYSKDQIDSAIKLAEDIKEGNYDTNPLNRTVKVYNESPVSKDDDDDDISDNNEKEMFSQSSSSSSSSSNTKKSGNQNQEEVLFDFFGNSNQNNNNNNNNVNTNDNFDFFGNNTQQNNNNNNDTFDFFAQPSSNNTTTTTTTSASMIQPQSLPPPPRPNSSKSTLAPPPATTTTTSTISTGNSFLDQLLGEYSTPTTTATTNSSLPPPMQPQNVNTNTNTNNSNDTFDFFKF